MNQRQEIIERLKALELTGGSHEMLSAICRAVAPGAQFGWTQGVCDGLRLRLIWLARGDDYEDALQREHERAYDAGYDEGFASADDWCAQHEDAMTEHGWVRLPKDADGEYIHIGDKVTCCASVWEVTGLRFTGGFWGICCTIFNDQGGSGTNVYPPSDLHHYQPPTVEDLLRDMHSKLDEVTALYVGEAIDSDERDSDEARIFAEYAAKLQLREDA